jgi:streptogramin lyase
VANCFASGADPGANVVRIDATTLGFEATWPVPGGRGFYRGLAYGGGSLWVSEISGMVPPESHSVTQVDPLTGALRSIALAEGAGALAWSEGYGDLWISNFSVGSVSRMHAATEALDIVDAVARNPAQIAIDGENVWVADWAVADVARLDAVTPTAPRTVSLPASNQAAGVWSVATGHGSVWATTPRDGALWRIDPTSNDVVRVTLPHLPTGVATDAGGVWVTVRGE